MGDLESIARKVLELWAEGPVDDVVELLHPDATIAPKAAGGEILQGRDQTREWLTAAREWPLYRIKLTAVSPLANDAGARQGPDAVDDGRNPP
jgi:SnoaL-like domain